ncbi:YceI family protein [Psychroserpens mesophilus]|uniref:YceI family protein n=1 Tax=Psychroserpens mesophilus TaxID=325473 RepID=UPI003D662BA6
MAITNVIYHNQTHIEVYTNLTIKDITNPIKFKAKVDFDKKQMNTKFKIDRMKCGITYNSDIKDSTISDAIGFNVKLSL